MLQIIGSLFILVASTAAGFYQASLIANRPKHIRQLIQSLQRLETEIFYALTPLPEAVHRVGMQCSSPLHSIYMHIADLLREKGGRTAQQCWNQGIEQGWGNTAMRKNEKEIMLRLGHTLGISDREDQMKHIKLAVGQLSAEEDTARENQLRYEKMWKSLGVLFGVLVVILLL
ncbi:stage III sporulation protein SpoIIIAB [Marinicrinis lubricantis]|uniref:Stage III sporulation protein SpoIIIAB n=1 Tax=Marinicrinis lubricantis TaxID=2086470 RepID=A0ABW1ISK1_9BACL